MTVKDKDIRTGETNSQKLPLYIGDEKVSGKIEVRTKKKFDHMGVKVELIGLIEVNTDAATNSTFMSNGLDLEAPGSISEDKTFNFSFNIFQKPYESYYGSTVRLRYIIRATIQLSKFKSPIVKEQDLGVLVSSNYDEEPSPINMEVGVEELINLKIDFPRDVFHLKDVIEGAISFLTVKLMIEKMELAIHRKEIIGVGEKAHINDEEIYNYEIMDGCPIKGELIRGGDSGPDVHERCRRFVPNNDQHQQQILSQILHAHNHPR